MTILDYMFHPHDPEQWYKPERDGNLDDYLREHDGISACTLFVGYSWYETLKKEGYLIPNRSIIRLRHGFVEDEHFIVNEDYELRGSTGGAHAGRPGTHKPEDILLEEKCWEASHLNISYKEED